MSNYRRILITGASGFLGSHITQEFKAETDAEIIEVNRDDFDLLDPLQVKDMLTTTQPDAVIHLAAKVGGIIANAAHPASFFYDNIMMNTMMLDACCREGVTKFLTLMGGCSYPATAISPISEDQMWNGFPQPESAAYSVAKKTVLVQSQAYRQEHGFNSIVLIPGNVYGPHDNFRMKEAHVVPAMIRRFLEARDTQQDTVTCFGSGAPTRDFVFASDVARLIPWFLEEYNSSNPINISSGTRTSIKELALMTAEATGYSGTIEWDTAKPDGQMDKIFCVEELTKLGLSCDTSLRDGLEATVDWFMNAREKGTVRS